MRHRAVLFDLFGTLVPCYPLALVATVIREMAKDLGLPAERFASEWARTYPLRRRRAFASLQENIEHVLESLGFACQRESVLAAARRRIEFEASTLSPRPRTLETLALLRSRGVRLGIISNCSIETAHVWDACPLSVSVDRAVLSCVVRVEKPEPAIYLEAAAALSVDPAECVFVGDGSDDELLGAKRLGMKPVLIRALDDDDSFPGRIARSAWKETSISDISQVIALLK